MDLYEALNSGLNGIKQAMDVLDVRGERNARIVVLVTRMCDDLLKAVEASTQEVTSDEQRD